MDEPSTLAEALSILVAIPALLLAAALGFLVMVFAIEALMWPLRLFFHLMLTVIPGS